MRAVALVPRLEQETSDAALHAVESVDLERRVVFGKGLEQWGELVGVGIEVVEVRWLWRAADHENDPLILVRCQLVLGELEQHRDQAQDDHSENQHHRAAVQGAVQQALVAALDPLEQHVKAMGQPAGIVLPTQQQGTHHRRQGKGDDARDDHRPCQGQGELLEQGAGEPGQEADRCVNRSQGDGHRHHWHGDFPRPFQRGVQRRFAFFHVPVDVFHHDDGIVHYQADGQYHCQQG